jgi:lipopolysaccharide biosynthesis glycosyltransferase
MLDMISSRKKNLVFLAVYCQSDYLKLFNLFFVSLFRSEPKREDFALLVMTSPSFSEKLLKIVKVIDSEIDVHIWVTEEKTDIFSAAFARYKIFEFERINEFQKILYLDTDVLLNGSLKKLFDCELVEDCIYCLPEGGLADESDFYGRSLLVEAGLAPDHLFGDGFTSGVLLFANSISVRNIFHAVIHLGYTDRARGRTFVCLDQPYLNFICTLHKAADFRLMPRYMVNNPTSYQAEIVINHFPGGPGHFTSKFSKMSRYLMEILRQGIEEGVWITAWQTTLLGGAGLVGSGVALGKQIFTLSLSDGTNGLLVTNSKTEGGLFLAVPTFEVLSIEADNRASAVVGGCERRTTPNVEDS